MTSLRNKLDWLYEGDDAVPIQFRYGLVIFDCVTIAFIVVSSFFERNAVIGFIDVCFGLLILLDFCARFIASSNRLRELLNPATWADAVAIVSFLLPYQGEGAAFLRVLR